MKNLTYHLVQWILPFDIIFLDTDIAQRIILQSKRSGKNLKFTKEVDLGYKYIEKIYGGLIWYMMQSESFISNFGFKLGNEIGGLVPFNGQSLIFRFSIKEVRSETAFCY